MSEVYNTLFLRLEGALQAWGSHEGKFVIRGVKEAPTKSGIIGLICASMGLSRTEATMRLPDFAKLIIGIRIDRPGRRWWDYHTSGGNMGRIEEDMQGQKSNKANDIKTKITRREYLCDASFLVAVQGETALISEIKSALENPVWTLYLGRKSCPPSVPIFSGDTDYFESIEEALCYLPWRPRHESDKKPDSIECIMDWIPSETEPFAPAEAEVWYDIPDSFVTASYHPRFVIRQILTVGDDNQIKIGEPKQNKVPPPIRPRADYTNSEYKKVRKQRLEKDSYLCVFCKSSATTVQHITYRNAGGNERIEELRSLCRLCHDAVTMIEYGENMGIDRINPEEPKWRKCILEKRNEIVKFRSLETKRRLLSGSNNNISEEEE